MANRDYSVQTPLPDPLNANLEAESANNSVYSVYVQLWQAERSLENPLVLLPQGLDENLVRIRIRVLGWFIIIINENPDRKDRMLSELAASVNLCSGSLSKYDELGKFYIDHTLRLFRKRKGHTPSPAHPSRDSFDVIRKAMEAKLLEPPRDHSAAKRQASGLKFTSALIRDGHRCIITGQWDEDSVDADTDVALRRERDRPDALCVDTQCAHILGSSKNPDIDSQARKADYAATAWALLAQFGYTSLLDQLNVPLIHRLGNVMTLALQPHSDFDTLKLWLEPINTEEHRYKVRVKNPDRRNYPSEITFVNHSPGAFLEMPNPDLLDLHATCAKVANLSGAADHFDEIDRGMDNITVLATDGSGIDVLDHAIWTTLFSEARKG